MTSAQAPETVGRRGIEGLIEDLREHGFAVSTSEAIDAAQLVVILARKEPAMDPDRLCARLRPVFCKTSEQQKSFDDIFSKWYGVKPAKTGPTIPDDKPVSLPPEKKPISRVWSAVALLIAITVVAVILFKDKKAVQPPAPEEKKAFEFGGGEIGGGGGSTGDLEPLVETPRAAVLGYFPRIRYNDELRPSWGWILAALPLLTLAGFSVPALVIARARTRRRSDPMHLDRRTLEAEAKRIVPPLRPEIAGKLARHLRGSPEGEFRLTRRPILDVRATIEKTLYNRGIPSPQYRHTHAPPSYLLLIDVANQRDPRGRLFYQWAERLQRERLDVEIALVRLSGEHPQYVPASHGGVPRNDCSWTSLARLPEPPFGQRLLLVSSGELLVDEYAKWRPEATAARLHRWRERAMFTPTEPRDWSAREDEIERNEHVADPGFLVLPLDENALSAWTDLLTTGQLSNVVLSEPQRYPALLRRGRAADFCNEEKPPDPARLDKLIDQLRVYLGDLGFTWLAALAIPPLVRWELTVLLGRDVVQRLTLLKPKDVSVVLARNYRRLARLPWLRLESMPKWLRLRLLAELAQTRQEELREVVGHLLGKLSPTPSEEGIALDFDRPPERDAAVAPGSSAKQDSDALYLGYMSGLTPRQLAMRAPREWGSWLGKMRFPRQRGLRGFFSSTADRARSWWARLVFRGGSPFRGLRGAPLVLAIVFLALTAGFLTLVAKMDRRWLPESLDQWLFTKEAHAIAFHHAAPVRTASFSPDGGRVVTASDDGTARVWDVRTGKALTPPLRHGGAVTTASFSPNGAVIATASGDTARLWDARTGESDVRRYRHGGHIRRIAFEPSGARFLTIGDSTVRIFRQADTAEIVLTSETRITDAAFSRDGRIVTASVNRVTLWNAQGDVLQIWPSATEILTATFSADGRFIVMGGRDGTTWISDAEGNPSLFFADPTDSVVHAEFSRDGRGLVTASVDGDVRVWPDWPGDKRPVVLRHDALLFTASFSPDSQRVVTSGADGTARVWDAATGVAIGSPLGHERAVTSATFSPDGMRIVTASNDGTARIWDAAADQPETPALRHRDSVTELAFDRTGRFIVTASQDDSARVWEVATGSQLSRRLLHDSSVWSARFSPDGGKVLTSSFDDTAVLWDWRAGRPAAPKFRHAEDVNYAVLSPDGRKVLTASDDETAGIWDAKTGDMLVQLRHERQVWYADFAPDGQQVVTTSFDNTARLSDSESGASVGAPLKHENRVTHAAYSADGRLVVTSSDDSTARIWDRRSGRPLTDPLKHSDKVGYAEFDQEGRRVVTAAGGIASIWDVATGMMLRALRHDEMVRQASFSPDGRRVLTGSSDGIARIWNADTGQLMAPPMFHGGALMRVAFSPDGKQLATASLDNGGSVAALPGEYIAPHRSAQIWRVPPWPVPDTSRSLTMRRRVVGALEDLSMIRTALAVAGVLLLPVLIIAVRRRKQLERLALKEAA